MGSSFNDVEGDKQVDRDRIGLLLSINKDASHQHAIACLRTAM
jgi:hypothetical protein